MNKVTKVYIGLLILLFIGAIYFELSRPTPVDWSPTFNEKHTKPYGLEVLHNELSNIFTNQEIIDIKTTPYEYFNSSYQWEDSTYTVNGNYIYINPNSFIDEISIEELIYFVHRGNNAFISTEYFPKILQDSLGFKTAYKYSVGGKGKLLLENPIFRKDSITISKDLNNTYFSVLDSLKTTVLGYQNLEKKQINFVKISYGKGNFYLHTQPYVFTNYHLLKNNQHKYSEALLSYLPTKTIFFDSINKLGNELGSSPLRYVFSQPALKWAWYIGLLALITFIIFNAKRKQRIIKIIAPLRNTTVDFTKTIANLYFETKEHTNIIDKKITYFLEKTRNDYYLETDILDEKFIKNLSLKSGNEKANVTKLINFIKYLQQKESCTENNLLDLNKLIENFYNKK